MRAARAVALEALVLVAAVVLLGALVAPGRAGAQAAGDVCTQAYGARQWVTKSESIRTKGDTVTVTVRCAWTVAK